MKNKLRASATRIVSAALAAAATAGVVFAVLPTTSSQAATATATMSVSANIGGTCTGGGSQLSFGPYSSSAAATTSANISVTCSNGTSAVVSLNQGNNNNRASTYATR